MVEIAMRCLTVRDMPDGELARQLADPLTRKELKIGISTGRFLCLLAAANPKSFFVGVELKPEASRKAALLAIRRSLDNVVVVNMEAYDYVHAWVGADTFDVIHIYFPTPYPTYLNIDRRLLCPAFIDEARRVLKPGGTLRIATDVKDYYEDICRHLDARHWWAVNWKPLGVIKGAEYVVGSVYERRFKEKGARVYSLQLIRLAC
jgi:tRNA (guanine-N7-)-methyltransferase